MYYTCTRIVKIIACIIVTIIMRTLLSASSLALKSCKTSVLNFFSLFFCNKGALRQTRRPNLL